jgi:hypothetical protein
MQPIASDFSLAVVLNSSMKIVPFLKGAFNGKVICPFSSMLPAIAGAVTFDTLCDL